MEQKDSRAKRAGKSVANFLNRVNRGENDAIAAKRQEREKLMEIAADAGMTYATRGTNKLAAGAAPKKAKGGELKGMKKIRLKKSFSDKYMPGVTHIYFDKSNSKYYFLDFEGDPMELKNKYVFEQLKKEGIIMAKGGEMKDDKWIQSTVKEMEKKGTVGLFTKKAKRRGMTTKEFMREVLRNPKKYTLKTRREAQWMANVTGDEYEWGGKVDTGTDVADTLNSAYEYAKGGEIEKYQVKRVMRDGTERIFDENLTLKEAKEVKKEYTDAKQNYYEIKIEKMAKGGTMKLDYGSQDSAVFVVEYMPYTKIGNPSDQRKFYRKKKLQEAIELGLKLYTDGDAHTVFVYPDQDVEIVEGYNLIYKDEKQKDKYFSPKSYFKGGEIIFKKGGTMKKQGYNDKLDESLSMRKGKASTKKQSDKDRRDESKGMEKAMGKRAYASVGTMDKMAEGGQLDSISGTKKHFGISTAEWNKMSAKDKEDLRKKSKQDLEAGRKYRQGYNDKLDESLGNTDGKESTKKQSLKDRRDESKGEEKALGKRAYSSVSTMDKLLPFLSWHKK